MRSCHGCACCERWGMLASGPLVASPGVLNLAAAVGVAFIVDVAFRARARPAIARWRVWFCLEGCGSPRCAGSVRWSWGAAWSVFRAGGVSGGRGGIVRRLVAEAESCDGLVAEWSSAGPGRYSDYAWESPAGRGAHGRWAVPVDGVGRGWQQRCADRRYGGASGVPGLARSRRVGGNRFGFGSPFGVRVGVTGVPVDPDAVHAPGRPG